MNPDYSNIPLQKFILKVSNQKKDSTFSILCENKDKNISLEIMEKFFEPKIEYIDESNYQILVLGNPVWNDKIDKKDLPIQILKSGFNNNLIKKIDGEFLIIYYHKNKCSIKIINDRFSSIPIYYYTDKDKFIASYAYNDLWLYLKNENIDLCYEAFYEMIYFRRIFSDKTYDKKSKFLLPASILSWKNNSLEINKFHENDYKDLKTSISQSGKLLAKSLKQSIKQKTSDNKRNGLFLSGGFDTRTILSAFENSPSCFTATYNKKGNREYEVSRQLANLKKSNHYHLRIKNNHFSSIINKAVMQVGGMHQANSIFMGYRDSIKSKVDVLFHGHGLDYMFQGMYLPSSHLKIGNHTFSYKYMKKIPRNIVDYFINEVPYRVKYPYIHKFIKDDYKATLEKKLFEQINSLYEYIKTRTSDKYKQLEYFSFHAPSRHYSFSDHASIHSNTEQRTITYNNNLYELFCKLPVVHRFDRRVLRKALFFLDKRFFKIYHANTNLPLGSSLYQTFFEIKKKILKAFKIIPRDKSTDTHLQRTWPTHEWIIKNEIDIKSVALSIKPGCGLSKLKFLNLEKIEIEIKQWLNYSDKNIEYPFSKEMGDFIWSLITLEIFLNQNDNEYN